MSVTFQGQRQAFYFISLVLNHLKCGSVRWDLLHEDGSHLSLGYIVCIELLSIGYIEWGGEMWHEGHGVIGSGPGRSKTGDTGANQCLSPYGDASSDGFW